jgi:uncharacterized protein YecT (DUF1311 family)
MRKLSIIIIIFLTSSIFCYSQTQLELNTEAFNNYKKADTKLNQVYSQILKEYKSDVVFITNLKNSQRLWIQFRDAEMKAKYPQREDGYYGSIFPLCWNLYLKELTEERIKKLNIWLVGIPEGDACNGSVKMKE